MEYYKFPVKDNKKVVIFPENYKVCGYAPTLELLENGLLNIAIGCQKLKAVTVETLDLILSEIADDTLIIKKAICRLRTYRNHIEYVVKEEVSVEGKDYYLTEDNRRLAKTNWREFPFGTQEDKKYFTYSNVDNNFRLEFLKNQVVPNPKELVDFIEAVKEFINNLEDYRLIAKV